MIRSRAVFAIPVHHSCHEEASKNFSKWQECGYQTAALVNTPMTLDSCDRVFYVPDYFGWAWATNYLAHVLRGSFDWLIAGGHDVQPDDTKYPNEVIRQLNERFSGTYGVMQPAGDKYGAIKDQTACVSPWIGAEFCIQHGPFHEGYYHFWGDSELMCVAQAAERLWWREDMKHYHDHHARRPGAKGHPKHLQKASDMNAADKALFLRRKAAGFPMIASQHAGMKKTEVVLANAKAIYG